MELSQFSLVGKPVVENDEEFERVVIPAMEAFIKSRPGNEQFRPRDADIAVKNCSTVDRSVRDSICQAIFTKLLSQSNIVVTATGANWNRGGRFALNELISLFPPETLRQLKTEHGGLQTLLKNHHQAFKVVGGIVEIRYEDQCSDTDRKRKRSESSANLRTKNCWHYSHHPDGCPYSAVKCRFIHQTAVDK